MKKKENQEHQVKIRILKIKELEFAIDESYDGDLANPNIDFNLSFDFDIKAENVSLILNIKIYPQANNSTELVRFKSVTIFKISPIKQFKTGSESSEKLTVDLPDDLIATLLGISFSHSRAILAIRTAGTKYEEIILPIINPQEVMKSFQNQ